MNEVKCDHNHCRRCCAGVCSGCLKEIILTEDEIRVLGKFAQVSFLPIASDYDGSPVYLEESLQTLADCDVVLITLQRKHLISIDYDMPLSNFDYCRYEGYEKHGSMALTSLGQYVIDQIDVQNSELMWIPYVITVEG